MDKKNSKVSEALKFLCSYNGKILPRRSDGVVRYVGGLNRVLSIDRSISFAELMVKIGEFCGSSATLKCQLPNGDLETLISITSDEDLANLIEEYDRASSSKIRAVLFPRKSVKTVSPPPSVAQSVVDFSPPSKPPPFPAPKSVPNYFVSRGPSPLRFAGKVGFYPCSLQGNLHQYQHHHHRHYQHYHQVPPSYYWQ
ncbi:hypothetical protein TIFTF001_015189 [Ficus carica]|uniref:PB1 domain-containing protein n=1 Tax=Ficus carica TaxID=3494 RepID=A0AA88A6Q8_FICCA|nr:hypothetical protein TIFTF001_015189 [Ficus carica]